MGILGERIKQARLEAGYYSQKKFGFAIGVSRQSVSNMEKENKLPGRERLEKIAEVTKKPIDYFYAKSSISQMRDKEGIYEPLIEMAQICEVLKEEIQRVGKEVRDFRHEWEISRGNKKSPAPSKGAGQVM